MTNIAVSALVANSVTQGLFNANIIDFFTGRTDGVYKAGADGSWRMTLPELVGYSSRQGFGGTYGAGIDFQSALMKNLKDNWLPMAAGVILIPVVAKTATKLIRKPVILPANRMLKSVGMDVKL